MRTLGIILAAGASIAMLAACAPRPVDPEQVALLCEERARAAAGPTGSVTVGANSNSGGFAGAQISLSGDFLAGRDPYEVYNSCVYQRTGQLPTRPPRL